MFESFTLAEQQRPSTRTSIPSTRASASSPRCVPQVTPDTSVAAALVAMANEIKELKLSAQRGEVCRGGHDTRDCPINYQGQVSFAGNQNQNRGYNNYNNFYGLGWRSGNNPPGFIGRHNQQGRGEAGASSGSSLDLLSPVFMMSSSSYLVICFLHALHISDISPTIFYTAILVLSIHQ
ncbi:hypothetical protein L1987_24058 [Smallanthus sonchifolius]|uniref:Uncharacterized protein n=1 Tax=Smallanthus sonchifolius TaxID=185202 RepID=A0ACB9IL46_9ASTR|nr:hypothetical protein L1987_24058 [Smallanthus sonchifolius]